MLTTQRPTVWLIDEMTERVNISPPSNCYNSFCVRYYSLKLKRYEKARTKAMAGIKFKTTFIQFSIKL